MKLEGDLWATVQCSASMQEIHTYSTPEMLPEMTFQAIAWWPIFIYAE